jgi:hypothetical protein
MLLHLDLGVQLGEAGYRIRHRLKQGTIAHKLEEI